MKICTTASHVRDEIDGNCITCADRDHYNEGRTRQIDITEYNLMTFGCECGRTTCDH